MIKIKCSRGLIFKQQTNSRFRLLKIFKYYFIIRDNILVKSINLLLFKIKSIILKINKLINLEINKSINSHLIESYACNCINICYDIFFYDFYFYEFLLKSNHLQKCQNMSHYHLSHTKLSSAFLLISTHQDLSHILHLSF